MNILVVQSISHAPIGLLGEALACRGAILSTWTPWTEPQPPLPPQGEYDGLIILGGPMNAHEDDQFPHLRQTVDLIHQFRINNKPIMGICLGAQLIARAFGCQVYAAATPELGFTPIRLADPTALEPWLQHLPVNLHLMQWHFDTFDLPEAATLLMTNDTCANQAYRIGSNIYGFQFHLEITSAIALGWLALKQQWIATNRPQLELNLKQQLILYAEQSAKLADRLAQHWLDLVRQF